MFLKLISKATYGFLLVITCYWMFPSQPTPILFSVSTTNSVGERSCFPIRIDLGSSNFYSKVRVKVYCKAFTEVVDGKDTDVMVTGMPKDYISTTEGRRFYDVYLSFNSTKGEYIVYFEVYDVNNKLIISKQRSFIVENKTVYSGICIPDCLFVIGRKNLNQNFQSMITSEERRALDSELTKIYKQRKEIAEQRKKKV